MWERSVKPNTPTPQVDFRAPPRGGASDDELAVAMHRALDLKPERHEFREHPDKLIRFMNMTGG